MLVGCVVKRDSHIKKKHIEINWTVVVILQTGETQMVGKWKMMIVELLSEQRSSRWSRWVSVEKAQQWMGEKLTACLPWDSGEPSQRSFLSIWWGGRRWPSMGCWQRERGGTFWLWPNCKITTATWWVEFTPSQKWFNCSMQPPTALLGTGTGLDENTR